MRIRCIVYLHQLLGDIQEALLAHVHQASPGCGYEGSRPAPSKTCTDNPQGLKGMSWPRCQLNNLFCWEVVLQPQVLEAKVQQCYKWSRTRCGCSNCGGVVVSGSISCAKQLFGALCNIHTCFSYSNRLQQPLTADAARAVITT